MAIYYISKSLGDDLNNGTSEETPWENLSRIASATINAGDRLRFRCGDRWDEQSLSIDFQGTSVNRIVYESYGIGAKPIFSGFRTITAWVNEGGGIYSYQSNDLPEYLRILVIDEVMRGKGKFPNQGFLPITSNATTTSLTSSGLTDVINYAGAEIVTFVADWVTDKKIITSHVAETLTFTDLISTARIDTGFFIQNHISCLNDLGDWMYNISTKRLYVYFGADPVGFEVKLSVVENMIDMFNYQDNKIEFHNFNNIKFIGINGYGIKCLDGLNNNFLNCDYEYIGIGAIRLLHLSRNLDKNNLIGNTAKYCGTLGFDAGAAVIDADVYRNIVQYCGLDLGLVLSGDNHAHAIGVAYASGINANNITVIGNRVRECGYNGIRWAGINAIIEKNIVDGFCRKRRDGGGFYTWDRDHEISSGIVRKNIAMNGGPIDLINDLPVPGLSVPDIYGFYFDEGSGDIVVEDNLSYNNIWGGFYLNDPRNRSMILMRNLAMNNGHFSFRFRGNSQIPIRPTSLNIQQNIWFTNRPEFVIDFFGVRNYPSILMSTDSYTDGSDNYGVMNNNYFLKHSNRNTIIQKEDDFVNFTPLSLADWQTDKSLELDSKTQPSINLANATPVYNDSLTSKSYTFTGSAVDVENVTEPNSFTLEPFGFKLLIGDVTVSAGVVVDNDIRVNLSNVIIG